MEKIPVFQTQLYGSSKKVKASSDMWHKKVYGLSSGPGEESCQWNKAMHSLDRENGTLKDSPPGEAKIDANWFKGLRWSDISNGGSFLGTLAKCSANCLLVCHHALTKGSNRWWISRVLPSYFADSVEDLSEWWANCDGGDITLLKLLPSPL